MTEQEKIIPTIEKVILKIIAKEKENRALRKKNISPYMESKLADLVDGAGYEQDMCGIVLDLLDVPEDNTVEINAYEVATETGVWPDNAFCRDYLYDRWYAMIEKPKSDPQKFIRVCMRTARDFGPKKKHPKAEQKINAE